MRTNIGQLPKPLDMNPPVEMIPSLGRKRPVAPVEAKSYFGLQG